MLQHVSVCNISQFFHSIIVSLAIVEDAMPHDEVNDRQTSTHQVAVLQTILGCRVKITIVWRQRVEHENDHVHIT